MKANLDCNNIRDIIEKCGDSLGNFFFSINVGCDTPFYDKECIEEGDFSWSCKELGYTIFINPFELYEEERSKNIMFIEDSGEI